MYVCTVHHIGLAVCALQRSSLPGPAAVAAGAFVAESPRADALCGVRSHAPLQTSRPADGPHVGRREG